MGLIKKRPVQYTVDCKKISPLCIIFVSSSRFQFISVPYYIRPYRMSKVLAVNICTLSCCSDLFLKLEKYVLFISTGWAELQHYKNYLHIPSLTLCLNQPSTSVQTFSPPPEGHSTALCEPMWLASLASCGARTCHVPLHIPSHLLNMGKRPIMALTGQQQNIC